MTHKKLVLASKQTYSSQKWVWWEQHAQKYKPAWLLTKRNSGEGRGNCLPYVRDNVPDNQPVLRSIAKNHLFCTLLFCTLVCTQDGLPHFHDGPRGTAIIHQSISMAHIQYKERTQSINSWQSHFQFILTGGKNSQEKKDCF